MSKRTKSVPLGGYVGMEESLEQINMEFHFRFTAFTQPPCSA